MREVSAAGAQAREVREIEGLVMQADRLNGNLSESIIRAAKVRERLLGIGDPPNDERAGPKEVTSGDIPALGLRLNGLEAAAAHLAKIVSDLERL